MRLPAFLVGALVAASALVALSPSAAAATEKCSSLVDPACPGVYCEDENGDRIYQPPECVPPFDPLDPCAFQSDCCDGALRRGFWCPPDS